MLVIDTGLASAEENMAIDHKLLHDLSSNQQCSLHFYDWDRPSATYGYFLNPSIYINPQASIQLARRSTGGGMIFHIWDFAFSITIPANHPHFTVNTLTNYCLINGIIAQTLSQNFGLSTKLLESECQGLDSVCTNFCMATPTQNDVMINGRKIGGGAQRRTRHGFLHQGTISVSLPDYQYLESVLVPGSKLLEAMSLNTSSLTSQNLSKKEVFDLKVELKKHLSSAFLQAFN